MNKIIYKWEFSDKKDRGKTWYILAIAFIIGISVWGVLKRQYGLSFVVILVSGVMFFIENNSPDIIKVEINELGIKVSDFFYDFSKIENYCFVYDKENAVFLKLWLKNRGLKSLNLNIDNDICLDLKKILPDYLKKEEKRELTKTEKIINILKL